MFLVEYGLPIHMGHMGPQVQKVKFYIGPTGQVFIQKELKQQQVDQQIAEAIQREQTLYSRQAEYVCD